MKKQIKQVGMSYIEKASLQTGDDTNRQVLPLENRD